MPCPSGIRFCWKQFRRESQKVLVAAKPYQREGGAGKPVLTLHGLLQDMKKPSKGTIFFSQNNSSNMEPLAGS